MKDKVPPISIIIPVLKEAAEINGLIDHLNSLKTGEKPEIIIVDGSEDGDTLKAVARGGPLLLSSPQGRARQMNAGAASARGDILLFLHADTRLPTTALERIGETMKDGRFAGGAFNLRIRSDRLTLKLISRLTSARSRITRVPYGDQAIFMRAAVFHEIGGYREIPLMEDVDLMHRVRKAGLGIHIIAEPAVTSSRRWEKEGVLACTLRNRILSISYRLGASPETLSRFYPPHP